MTTKYTFQSLCHFGTKSTSLMTCVFVLVLCACTTSPPSQRISTADVALTTSVIDDKLVATLEGGEFFDLKRGMYNIVISLTNISDQAIGIVDPDKRGSRVLSDHITNRRSIGSGDGPQPDYAKLTTWLEPSESILWEIALHVEMDGGGCPHFGDQHKVANVSTRGFEIRAFLSKDDFEREKLCMAHYIWLLVVHTKERSFVSFSKDIKRTQTLKAMPE